jgi:hypothetical protein
MYSFLFLLLHSTRIFVLSVAFSLYVYELIIMQYEPSVYPNQKHSPLCIRFGGNGSVYREVM